LSILTRIADAFGFGKAQSRPQNVTYSDSVMEAFGVQGGAAGQSVTAISAMRVAAVFACVEKIAGAIGTLPLHIYKFDGETPVRQPRDDLWFKLNELPTTSYTASAHWENKNAERLLRGDSFTLIRYGLNGNVRDLLPLPWECVNPLVVGGVVKYYINVPELGISTWVPPEEILHFKSLGFDARRMRSPSTIQYGARAAVGNALAMDQYSGKFFENGAHPSIILKAEGKMSPEQITNLQQAFANKYAGSDNFHRLPLVLTEKLDAKEISLSAQDAQLLEARKFQVIDIARAFGVPPHMIGETSASTSWGSGIEAMSRGFVTYTLKRHLKYLEDELNSKLFPRNTGRFVKFDLSELIEGDSKAQADYNRAALGGPGTGMGWQTVDEIRAARGLKPLGGKAAELFDPNAVAEAQMAAAEANKPDPAEQDKAAAKNLDAMRQIANEAQKPTVVNVAAPIVNVTVPEQAAPIVQNTVNVPETTINVEAVMPQQDAPVVNNVVNVEKQDAPVVNVAAPVVNVAAADIPEPVIRINNIPATEMKITSMPDRVTTSTVKRDGNGNITQAVNTEKDA
jgi:HK97 family phage portal protein